MMARVDGGSVMWPSLLWVDPSLGILVTNRERQLWELGA